MESGSESLRSKCEGGPDSLEINLTVQTLISGAAYRSNIHGQEGQGGLRFGFYSGHLCTGNKTAVVLFTGKVIKSNKRPCFRNDAVNVACS